MSLLASEGEIEFIREYDDSSNASSLDNLNKQIENVREDDVFSNASSSDYSNIHPFTQLSPLNDNCSLSHSSFERDKTINNLDQDCATTRSISSLSDISTNDDSKISNKSSSGSPKLSNDSNKYIHYGQTMKPSKENETEFLKDTIEDMKKNTVEMIYVAYPHDYPDLISPFEILSGHECGDNRYIDSIQWSGLLICYVMVQKNFLLPILTISTHP